MRLRAVILINCALYLACSLTFCRFASAQVNIFDAETARQMELGAGWYNNIALNLTAHAGNTDLLTLKTRFRSDYLAEKYHLFIMGNLHQGSKDSKSFINKALIHLRGIRSVSQDLAVETFVQKQFNDFIRLQDRNLVGGGFRIAPLGKVAKSESDKSFNLYIGIGLMWEDEVINDDSSEAKIESNIIRSTNYVTWTWRIDERLTSAATGYYQFQPASLSDYRILFEGSIGFRLTKKLGLTTWVGFRYDNEPPTNVKKHDLEIVNGFNFTF